MPDLKKYRMICPICKSDDLLHCQVDHRIKVDDTARVFSNGELSEQIICKVCGYVMEFINPNHLQKGR